MAPGYNRDETEKLRATAAEMRLQSIKAQLSAAFTFCRTIETDLSLERVDVASKLLQRVRHAFEVIRDHLNEPGNVPPQKVHEARNELARLEARIAEVEAAFRNR